MIRLKYFQRSDFQQLIEWIDTPEFLMQWGGSQFTFPLTEEQLDKYLRDANNEQSKTLAYSVEQQQTKQIIGHISLGNIDKKNNSARIGRVLVGNKSVRGQGIGQQMVKYILKVAFNDLHLHRVTLGVFDFNDPAIACYQKVGFVKEGVSRESKKVGDEYWNLWEMSMLEGEWKQLCDQKSVHIE